MRLPARLAAVLFLSGILATPVFPAPPALPPVGTVEEGRERLRFLKEELDSVERWVEENCEAEFAARHPDLVGLKKVPEGPSDAAREREMRSRLALSTLKETMRAERKKWLEKEMADLLSREIRGYLAVRPGPYDRERGEYPLLLGFGWPAGLIVRVRVPEREKEVFAARLPKAFPAGFRLNGKGEVTLVSLDRGRGEEEISVYVAPPGPRLVWQGSHDSWVTSVAYRPDGSQVISAGADGALCAWDADTGFRLWRRDDVEMALSVSYSPDGTAFATGGADSNVRLREAGTGAERWRAPSSGMIFSVAFSPDGRHIASGDDGGTVRVWSADSGREILRTDLGAPVRSVAFSPSGRAIAAGTERNLLVLWEMVTGRQLWRRETGYPVFSVDVGARGLVAAGGAGNRLDVFRESDGTSVWSRKADGEIRSVRFDAEGRLLGDGGSGYRARVFLGATGEPLWSASIGSPVRAVAFGPAGSKLLVGSADFSVRLFEVDEGYRVLAAYCPFGRLYIERDRVQRIFR